MQSVIIDTPRCFYRRILPSYLHGTKGFWEIDAQAFMPSEIEEKVGFGPSVLAADVINPYQALLYKSRGKHKIVNWCKDKGGHLAEFSEKDLPGNLKIRKYGKDPAHYQFDGSTIYPDPDKRYAWAYLLAAKAQLRLHCKRNNPLDVQNGVSPCGG